ncbi:MAG TPA: hypothetical protein VF625_17855, partial [Longimicrobium sp.]
MTRHTPPRPFRRPPRDIHAAIKPLLGILFILMGAGAGVLSIPWLIHVIPHDAARTGAVLDALEGDAGAEMVVFGTSVAMRAIDTRLLGTEIARGSGGGRAPVIHNFGAEGQQLAEAGLMYQDLPESVHTVIQLVNPGQDLGSRQHLWPGKYTALYMYGYRPDPVTRAAMIRVYGEPMRALFARSALSHNAEARWVVRTGLDVLAHRALRRNDLDFRKYENDLYFPSIYTTRIPPAEMEAALVATRASSIATLAKRTTPESVAMMIELCGLVARTRPTRRLVFLLEPGHPALAGTTMPDAVER